MKILLGVLIIIVSIFNYSFGQEIGTLQYKNKQFKVKISYQAIDSIKSSIEKYPYNDPYKKAWSTCTISQMYLLLNNQVSAQKYFLEAKTELKKLSPDSLCICLLEINSLIVSQYNNIPNGVNFDIVSDLNDIGINELPKCNNLDINNFSVFFLTNNAAQTWKYNYSKAIQYFEKLRTISTPIALRDILSPNEANLELIKDPLRRYVRFMYNLVLSPNATNQQLCNENNCLENAWLVTQLLKSRTFKYQLFKESVNALNKEQNSVALSCIRFLDSIYYSSEYPKSIILNNFKMNFPIQKKVDSTISVLNQIVPVFDLLISDKISISQLKNTLKENEIYVSIMYMDNRRNVYALKLEKNKAPNLIKLDIMSLDLFFRTEYFKNKKINQPSYITIREGDTLYKYDLQDYLKVNYPPMLDPVTNEKFLYEKLVKPLKLAMNKRIILEIDQNLGSFPIGLIKNPATGKLVLEENEFVYTPSASIFYYLRTQNITDQYELDYIGFSYNSSKRTFVDSIIQASSLNFKNNQIYFQTTENQIYSSNEALKNSRYLHFACHNNITGNRSQLAFKSQGISDGLITEDEIINKIKNHSLLTVLTSCTTAPYLDDYDFIKVYKENNNYYSQESCVCSIGETFSNITSAFFAAGSKKLLVTQWQILDSPISALFMADFFHNVSSNFTFNEALKLSQEKFSKNYDVHYWGGYILVGD
ncbi:MAG: CHAT domain-containing protein [Bacteroidia bacterium]